MTTERTENASQLKRGRNPILETVKKPPQLGQTPTGNPTSTGGWKKPNSFKGGLRGSFSGRLGQEGPPSGGPGVASFLPAPSPELNSDYFPGLPTNYTIPYAKIVRRYKHELIKSPQIGLVIVTRKEEADPVTKRTGMENRRYTMLNIPAWNYMQSKTEKNPMNPNDVLNAEDLWKDWTLEGVVRTEEGQEYRDYKDERGKERILNVIVKGHAHVHNAWSQNIKSGTRLYLILKKQKQKQKINPYSSDMNSSSSHYISSTAAITEKPFQLTSWADHKYDIPPDSVLQYEDEFGYKHRGIYIYVGTVENPAVYPVDRKPFKKSDINLDSLLSEPKIFIFVDA